MLFWFNRDAFRTKKRISFLRWALRPLPRHGQIRPQTRSLWKRVSFRATPGSDIRNTGPSRIACRASRQHCRSDCQWSPPRALGRGDSHPPATGCRVESSGSRIRRNSATHPRRRLQFHSSHSLPRFRDPRRFVPRRYAATARAVRSVMICDIVPTRIAGRGAKGAFIALTGDCSKIFIIERLVFS